MSKNIVQQEETTENTASTTAGVTVGGKEPTTEVRSSDIKVKQPVINELQHKKELEEFDRKVSTLKEGALHASDVDQQEMQAILTVCALIQQEDEGSDLVEREWEEKENDSSYPTYKTTLEHFLQTYGRISGMQKESLKNMKGKVIEVADGLQQQRCIEKDGIYMGFVWLIAFGVSDEYVTIQPAPIFTKTARRFVGTKASILGVAKCITGHQNLKEAEWRLIFILLSGKNQSDKRRKIKPLIRKRDTLIKALGREGTVKKNPQRVKDDIRDAIKLSKDIGIIKDVEKYKDEADGIVRYKFIYNTKFDTEYEKLLSRLVEGNKIYL